MEVALQGQPLRLGDRLILSSIKLVFRVENTDHIYQTTADHVATQEALVVFVNSKLSRLRAGPLGSVVPVPNNWHLKDDRNAIVDLSLWNAKTARPFLKIEALGTRTEPGPHLISIYTGNIRSQPFDRLGLSPTWFFKIPVSYIVITISRYRVGTKKKKRQYTLLSTDDLAFCRDLTITQFASQIGSTAEGIFLYASCKGLGGELTESLAQYADSIHDANQDSLLGAMGFSHGQRVWVAIG